MHFAVTCNWVNGHPRSYISALVKVDVTL